MENEGRILLWNVEQAAAALSISPWTIRAYIRQGKITPVRIGRRVLFEPHECQRFLKVCKKPSSRRDSGGQLPQDSMRIKGNGVIQA